MTVVIVGSRAVESLEQHLADSFRTLGHMAHIVDVTDGLPVSNRLNYWASRFCEPYDRAINKLTAIRISKFQPNLVLVVYRHTHPILVQELEKTLPGIPVAQLNPDALTNLEKQQIIATDFDYYFSKEPYLVDVLRDKAGLNAHYLPEAFNPRTHQKPPIGKAVAEELANIDVLMYGSLYPYRARIIEQLLRAGLRVDVYGTQGPYLNPAVNAVFRRQFLAGSQKNQLLYGAKIVLNTFHYAEITSVNQKYFEINGIGAFQLCDYKPTIEQYTGVPAELVTFRTIDEAIDKVRYYLDRPTLRHELAARQYAHFQQHHTFDERVLQLLQTVGLAEPELLQNAPDHE